MDIASIVKGVLAREALALLEAKVDDVKQQIAEDRIDELSTDLLRRYKKAAMPKPGLHNSRKTPRKRWKGIVTARERLGEDTLASAPNADDHQAMAAWHTDRQNALLKDNLVAARAHGTAASAHREAMYDPEAKGAAKRATLTAANIEHPVSEDIDTHTFLHHGMVTTMSGIRSPGASLVAAAHKKAINAHRVHDPNAEKYCKHAWSLTSKLQHTPVTEDAHRIEKGKRGDLHKYLNVPDNQPIPRGTLLAAINSNDPRVRQMAKYYLTQQQEKKKPVYESAPPGMEDWVMKNKGHFKSQYGEKKGLEVLYATAWRMHNKHQGPAAESFGVVNALNN